MRIIIGEHMAYETALVPVKSGLEAFRLLKQGEADIDAEAWYWEVLKEKGFSQSGVLKVGVEVGH